LARFSLLPGFSPPQESVDTYSPPDEPLKTNFGARGGTVLALLDEEVPAGGRVNFVYSINEVDMRRKKITVVSMSKMGTMFRS
jgi:hypothetical protein